MFSKKCNALQIPAHQSLLHLTRHTDLFSGVSGICAPVQNSEYTLNTQAFTNCASPPFTPVRGGIGEMVILPTSLLAPWLNPASISISASRLAPVYDRLLESPSQPK